VIRILQSDGGVTEVVRICEDVGSHVAAHGAEAFDIASTTRDNVCRRLGILHPVGIRHTIIDRFETLRVMHVSEDAKVDAIFVHQGFESLLARLADAPAPSRIPRPVSGHDEPGCDGAINRCQICLQELELLVRRAEGAAIQPRGTLIGRVREVRLRVDHGDVDHAVFEGEPERRIRQHLGLVGVHLGSGIRRGGLEGGGHGHAEASHEVGEILLSRGTQPGREVDLFAVGLVVPRARHVRLPAGDGCQLRIELLQDGLKGVFSIQEVLPSQQPVVGICQVLEKKQIQPGVSRAMDSIE